jgi:hypothetical protein
MDILVKILNGGDYDRVHDYDDDDDDKDDDNSTQFLYSSACEQRVAYNKEALKVYTTKATLRLELELD